MAVVKTGDLVYVHYTGTFESGEVFDSSVNSEPIYFIVGDGDIIEGFDTAVVGMKKGEKKQITLTPEQGYGDYDDERVITTTRENFGENFQPELNMQLAIELQGGDRSIATVVKFDDKNVTLDMNHPLAGKTLKFDLELVDIKDASEMPKSSCSSSSCESCCGGCH